MSREEYVACLEAFEQAVDRYIQLHAERSSKQGTDGDVVPVLVRKTDDELLEAHERVDATRRTLDEATAQYFADK